MKKLMTLVLAAMALAAMAGCAMFQSNNVTVLQFGDEVLFGKPVTIDCFNGTLAQDGRIVTPVSIHFRRTDDFVGQKKPVTMAIPGGGEKLLAPEEAVYRMTCADGRMIPLRVDFAREVSFIPGVGERFVIKNGTFIPECPSIN